jgi:hypothetical protein
MPLLVVFHLHNGFVALAGRCLVLPWPRRAWIAFVVLFLGFGLIRNLPFSCLDSLRPPPNPPGSR